MIGPGSTLVSGREQAIPASLPDGTGRVGILKANLEQGSRGLDQPLEKGAIRILFSQR